MVQEHSAGGVVYRASNGSVEILLIKDRYGRWTLPKGGIEEGETAEQAALREIEEETGVRGEIVSWLGSTRYWYTNAQGEAVHKVVDYYLVKALSCDLNPALGEIDAAEWVPVTRVEHVESYSNNRQVIQRAIELLLAARTTDGS